MIRLSDHARQRCTEMGIATKAVKRLADGRTAGVVYPAWGGRYHVRGPDFTVLMADNPDGTRWVVTVLFNYEHTRPVT